MLSYGTCLSLIISDGIQVAANGIVSFFLCLCSIPFYICTTSLPIHLSMDTEAVFLSILTSAAMNIWVQASF